MCFRISLCPETKKIYGLCKTLWVLRDNPFTTIPELDTYVSGESSGIASSRLEVVYRLCMTRGGAQGCLPSSLKSFPNNPWTIVQYFSNPSWFRQR